MNKGILSMFTEPDGKWSSQRFTAITVPAFWTLLIGIAWIVVSIKKGEMQEIPDSVTMIYVGIVGVALGANVIGTATKKNKSDK